MHDVFLTPQDCGIFKKRSYMPGKGWHVFYTQQNCDYEFDTVYAHFFVRVEGRPDCFVFFEDHGDYISATTLENCKEQMELIEKSECQFAAGDYPMETEDGNIEQQEYIAFDDMLVSLTLLQNEELEIRVFDLQKVELVKHVTMRQGAYTPIQAVAQKSDHVVLVSMSKCYMFSVSILVETGVDAITEFPLYTLTQSCSYCYRPISACIVGQLLIVCLSTNDGVQFFSCDLNKVLESSEQNKELTSSIWREMKIPDLIDKADWIDSVYWMHEKRVEKCFSMKVTQRI